MPEPSSDEVFREAIDQFGQTLERARGTSLKEPMAMSLATVDSDGMPDVRIVLLRGFDERGFVFYTNLGSQKGRQLAESPRAALCFHWDELTEQVRVRGPVKAVSPEEADAYWAGRPRESQIGAWASKQSRTLGNRLELERSVHDFERQFEAQEVPRPEFWSGFRLVPNRIEFWKGRQARLHDRTTYELHDATWCKRLQYP